MGKSRSTDKAQRATQQKIQAGMAIVTQGTLLAQPTKAELRASVPAYDESMVKRIPPNVKGRNLPKR
jgi:hypothetical protein